MQSSSEPKLLSLRNLFLYLVIVLLPILVAYFALANMIEEQFLARREAVKQELDLQSAKLAMVSTPEYQLNNFFATLFNNKKLVRQSPETIVRVIENIDKHYPEAFKWIFWKEDGSIMPIKSKLVLSGQRHWQIVLKNMMTKFNILGNPSSLTENHNFQKQFSAAMNTIQQAMGGTSKVEHLNWARNSPTPMSWLGKPCLAVWDVDTISYWRQNIPQKIRGGFMLMAFSEKIPENLWIQRTVFRRLKPGNKLKFPIAAINISEQEPVAIDKQLSQPNFARKLIDAYINRSQNTFYFDNFIARPSRPSDDSNIRLFSIADLSKQIQERYEIFGALRLTCILLLIITSLALINIQKAPGTNLSLRKRIAAIFMTAILMPILSLVSIGKTFISHEESRLKESAFVKMRSGIEALELRYKDTPRLIEKELFTTLHKYMGQPPYTPDSVETAMTKARKDGLIENFVLTDSHGKICRSNWHDLDIAIKKTLEMAASKMIKTEGAIADAGNSVLKDAIDDEVDEFMQAMGTKIDFSRPSHLRYFAYVDQHMYFMSITVKIDETTHPLFIHMPDYYIEKRFATHEFALNRLAAEDNDNKNQALRPELSFYSTFNAEPSIPKESDLWATMETSFKRSSTLKVEESGQVNIANENFLYIIKPLSSMFSQSFIPCLLTSTLPIEARLRDASIVVAALAFTALIGAVLLSLFLASSLLGPIRKIDFAAQQIGKGDLSVVLPDMGADELGRLSQTFNDMVKGLREREKMQAYVSDSVMEAIQGQADDSIHAGRNLEATILFSDIRNFTGMTEDNTPDKIFTMLNEFLGGVEPIIRNNNGRVDKFIGDAVMAVFHNTSPEHHALSAVKAGVQMKHFVKKLNQKRMQAGLFTINIGIGISTGTVLLGDVGSSRRKDLTVIGDEVNLASRLETASKKGRHSKIIFSGATYDIIRNYVEAEEMPFTEIRGKQQAISIYELIRLKKEITDEE